MIIKWNKISCVRESQRTNWLLYRFNPLKLHFHFYSYMLLQFVHHFILLWLGSCSKCGQNERNRENEKNKILFLIDRSCAFPCFVAFKIFIAICERIRVLEINGAVYYQSKMQIKDSISTKREWYLTYVWLYIYWRRFDAWWNVGMIFDSLQIWNGY